MRTFLEMLCLMKKHLLCQLYKKLNRLIKISHLYYVNEKISAKVFLAFHTLKQMEALLKIMRIHKLILITNQFEFQVFVSLQFFHHFADK